jgi:hypothetical protein
MGEEQHEKNYFPLSYLFPKYSIKQSYFSVIVVLYPQPNIIKLIQSTKRGIVEAWD